MAKFSTHTLLWLFSHNYYGNIDNNVIINGIIENCSNPSGTKPSPARKDPYLKIVKKY